MIQSKSHTSMQQCWYKLCCILHIFGCLKSLLGKETFFPLLQDKPQHLQLVNSDQYHLYWWWVHTAAASGQGKGLGYGTHWHCCSHSSPELNLLNLILAPFHHHPGHSTTSELTCSSIPPNDCWLTHWAFHWHKVLYGIFVPVCANGTLVPPMQPLIRIRL